MRRSRVAVLISGRGSNMSALIEATKTSDYPAEIVVVVSDNAEAAGLAAARAAGVEALAIPRGGFSGKAEHEAAIDRALTEAGVDIVCLAGFMRLLSAGFVERWDGRILNIHPSLLPRHKGLDTHSKAIAAGDVEHGCSVHIVNADMDEGPVIAQARVLVLPDDTAETLAARVLVEEHRLYPEALRRVAEGRIAGRNEESL